MTDQQIIQALIERDEVVTRQFFYVNCRPMLYKLISKIFSAEIDYEELISELYLHLMANDAHVLRTFKGDSTIYSWLYKVATRQFLKLKKRKYVIDPCAKQPLYDETKIEAANMSKQVAQIDVKLLLNQIPSKRKQFVLRRIVIEGMSYDELSKITGLNKDNLYSIKTRALKELQRISRLATTTDGNLCAIMCEEYILHVFGIHKTQEELKSLALSQKWLKSGGVEVMDLGAIPEYFGLVVSKRAPADIEDIEKALKKGYQVIVAVDGGELVGNPMEELAEDILVGGIADHCVVVLSVNKKEDTVTLFDPSIGVIPLTVSTEHFADAWEDSNNYMVTIKRKIVKHNTYTPHPVDLGEITITPQLEQLREAIAENVHDVWAAGRIRDGWTYGPERDDKLKKHPCLVPYSELPDSEKQYDRDTAMNTIKLLVKLGYDLVKR